ncbi:hypothetical protein NEF87_003108 [Candidatus Lokiarchaeum ossiferum]|uniref:Carboxypeptidase regulatory-like domain-containing protein n=1 Tax=Candidatus Lokiarchaeum ossiferum TaxID=2951803 RepID=A0ABY6HTH9_9ARCH|nr:hypothetical protein NEF87_003108 [Candidatus Lokiarchaeum sp. B-35]
MQTKKIVINSIILVFVISMIIPGLYSSGYQESYKEDSIDFMEFNNSVNYGDSDQDSMEIVCLYTEFDNIIEKSLSNFIVIIGDEVKLTTIPIASSESLQNVLETVNEHYIVIYFFHGDENGLIIDDQLTLEWEIVRNYVFASSSQFHYFASCYSATLDYNSKEKTIIGNEGTVDQMVASIVVSMSVGTTFESINYGKSKAILNRAVDFVEEDQNQFMERILNPIEKMDTLHYKSNIVRTAEDLFTQLENFFKLASQNPSIAFLQEIIKLIVGDSADFDIEQYFDSSVGIGGNFKVNNYTKISFWIGREFHTYKASEHSAIDFDVFADVIAIKIGIEFEYDQEITVMGVPVEVTFGIDAEMNLEFLLDYYASNPNNLHDLTGIEINNNYQNPSQLIAYVKTEGPFGEDKVLEAPFGSYAMGIPVGFRLYGKLDVYIKGEIGIDLKEKWDKLPNVTLPVEMGGRISSVFQLGGDGLSANVLGSVYGQVGWDEYELDIKIGKITANVFLRIELPVQALLVWDTLGIGIDNAYAYYPKISGEISASYESKIPMIPNYEVNIWTAHDGSSKEKFWFLPYGSPQVDLDIHPGNILLDYTNQARIGPSITEFVNFDLPPLIKSVLSGVGEIEPGSAFDRETPSINLVSMPATDYIYSQTLTNDLVIGDIIIHANLPTGQNYLTTDESVQVGSLDCELIKLVNPLSGDEESLTFETTDDHNTYNTDSSVKKVTVSIDAAPNKLKFRDQLSGYSYSGTNYVGRTEINLPEKSQSVMVRYLLKLHIDDFRSYISIEGNDEHSYGTIYPLSVALPQYSIKKVEALYQQMYSYLITTNNYDPYFGFSYSMWEDPVKRNNLISALNMLMDIDCEEFEELYDAITLDDVYIWTPWIDGESGISHFKMVGDDSFEIKAVEYRTPVIYSSDDDQSDVHGYIEQMSVTPGSATEDYFASWKAHMGLYYAREYYGLKNGWHKIYFTALDNAGLESTHSASFYIENPVDSIAPVIEKEMSIQEFVLGSTLDPSHPIYGLTTLRFMVCDPAESVVYFPQFNNGNPTTYRIDSGIDSEYGFQITIMSTTGDELMSKKGSISSISSDWTHYYAQFDFNTLSTGEYYVSTSIRDKVGNIQEKTYWIFVKDDRSLSLLLSEFGDSTSGWSLRTSSRNSLSETDISLKMEETSSGYSSPRQGYTYNTIDLSNWCGGDIQIDFKIRATSNYASSSVTNFAVGLTTDPNSGFNVFQHYEHRSTNYGGDGFESGKDSGWKSRSIIISEATLRSKGLIPGQGSVKLMWGFNDAWSTNWHQKVELDFISVYCKTPVSYNGYVSNIIGSKIYSAQVEIISPSGTILQTVQTASSGYFATKNFPSILNGNYQMRISKSGYKTQTKSVDADAGSRRYNTVLRTTSQITIRGYVSYKYGSGLYRASVRIKTSSGSQLASVLTSSNGYYSVTIDAGLTSSYNIYVSKPGYLSKSATISSTTSNYAQNFALLKTPSGGGGGIIVPLDR